MKKYFLIAVITVVSSSVNAQSSDKELYLTKSLSNERVTDIKMETTGGNITIIAAGTAEARLEVFVQPNNSRDNSLSKDEIKKRLEEEYNLDISVNGNKLTVMAKPKNRNMDWKRALNISFKAFVPTSISTDLSTSGGNIALKNITGAQDFSTSGGNLTIDNVGGKVKGRTSGGNLYIYNSKDDINLSTSGGNIEAENCTGNLILSTSGGNLNLKGLNGHIKATTSGGNVRGSKVEGELFATTSGGSVVLKDLSCSLETSTRGGNIDISIIALGKYVRINNSSGNVEMNLPKGNGLDLDLSAYKIKTDQLENFNGKMDDEKIVGKLNGGGVPVIVNAGSGNIVLGFKLE